MPEIILDSGTEWTVPNDWNDDDNSVETFGGGGGGAGGTFSKVSQTGGGGGAGAYCRGDNITLTKGATIQVRIGAGTGTAGNNTNGAAGGATCFNATSLSNAVSNGDAISVAAPGGSGGLNSSGSYAGGAGGVGTNGVGNHTRTSGGNGSNGGGTTGSGAGGSCPNGGAGGAGLTANGAGNPGTAPGGAGSGGRSNNIGGAGANGRIVINYTPLPQGQHRMFLAFSIAALLSGLTIVTGAFSSLLARLQSQHPSWRSQ